MQDYSAHKISAHKHLKAAHSTLLKNNFSEALKHIDEAIVELRMMKAAVRDLMEKVNGQTEQ
jgi:hypothetical protein